LRSSGKPITLKNQSSRLSRIRVLQLLSPPAAKTMRISPTILSSAIVIFLSQSHVAQAQTTSYEEERLAARRELQLAKIDFRNYWQIDYPRIRRHLDAQIQLTEAEIRVYKDRLWMYRPFDRFSTGSAVRYTLQDLRTCLMEAELRLRDLWAERNNLIRFRTPEWRELELRLHDARVRVAEIEAAIENAARAGATAG
jgi:hypothetical protein